MLIAKLALFYVLRAVCAAHGPDTALAAHKAHKVAARAAEAFGRRQGQRMVLRDADMIRSAGHSETYPQWQARCERQLKQAGLWGQVQHGRWDGVDHNHWEFAPAPPPSPSRELRVLWMMGDGSPHCFKNHGDRCMPLFERDFLFDWVLRDLPVRRRTMLTVRYCRTLSRDALYVFNSVISCTATEVSRLAAALRACNTPGTLVHLGDESGDMVKEFDYASWAAILRQYFSARTMRDTRWASKLVHIPLGYGTNYYAERDVGAWESLDDPVPSGDAGAKRTSTRALGTGVLVDGPRAPRTADEALRAVAPASARTTPWSFMGDVQKSTRPDMMRSLETVRGGYNYTSHGFAGADQARPAAVREALSQAVFCPAPTGWYNPDSYRFAEALEVGCFPLLDGFPQESWNRYTPTTMRYWEWYFAYYNLTGTVAPFVKLVDRWSDVPAWMEEQLEDKEKLDRLQRDMVEWWFAYKRQLAGHVASIVRKQMGFRGANLSQ